MHTIFATISSELLLTNSYNSLVARLLLLHLQPPKSHTSVNRIASLMDKGIFNSYWKSVENIQSYLNVLNKFRIKILD